MNFFENLFKPQRKSSSNKLYAVYQSLYPASVRYALQYNEAQMGKVEMRDLLPKYVYETVYLVVKATAEDRNQQLAFLQDLVQLYAQPSYTETELVDLLQRWLAELPDDVYVKGTKLAQLNRYGADHWLATFRELGKKIITQQPEAYPCLVANTTLFALHHFVDLYRNRPEAKILILVPDWMQDDLDDLMGYSVDLTVTPATVEFQNKDDCIFKEWKCFKSECPLQQKYCGNTVFIDDTINTGTTAGKLDSFWHSEYGLCVPEDRIEVITDLRGQGYVKAKPKD